MKWNQQLMLMNVIIRDVPIKEFQVGTSQREAMQDVLSHTWRRNAGGGFVTVSYMINFGTFGSSSLGELPNPIMLRLIWNRADPGGPKTLAELGGDSRGRQTSTLDVQQFASVSE